MHISKYTTIIKTAWQRALTYRFAVYSYRIGEIVENLSLIIMWIIIYNGGNQLIKGYSLNEMITYLLVGNLVDVIVRNWLSTVVAKDIKDGGLSMFLIKPIKYFRYIVTREIGRISFAFFMSVLTNLLVILFFKKYLILNVNWTLLIIFFMVILAFITEILISYLVGLIAFWTLEVDGIFYSMERVRKLLSGGYFPISLLPTFFVNISLLFPFAYSFYVPTQLYLGKMDLSAGLKGLAVQVAWIGLLYLIIKVVWRRGLKIYEGTGI